MAAVADDPGEALFLSCRRFCPAAFLLSLKIHLPPPAFQGPPHFILLLVGTPLPQPDVPPVNSSSIQHF